VLAAVCGEEPKKTNSICSKEEIEIVTADLVSSN
jgi:hypothetical protein